MTSTDRTLNGTYRCPVCGHRDSIAVVPGAPARRTKCSYCGVALDVSVRNEAAVNLSVKVAEEPVRG